MKLPQLLRRLWFSARTGSSRKRSQARLRLERLEDRIVPAVSFVFDYSRDINGFFANNAQAKATLEQAGADLLSRLTDSLSAIVPSGPDTWDITFFDPSNPSNPLLTISNPTIQANTILVFAGGETSHGGELGIGGPGGFDDSGDQAWLDTVQGRGQAGALPNTPSQQTDFGPWGGSVSFDMNFLNWNFGSGPIGPTQVDFYSVAQHELGHLIGFGTADSWKNQVSGSTFIGPNAQAEFGGPVPTDAAGSFAGHWADGTLDHGLQATMDPVAANGARTAFTALDYGGLADMGWQIAPPSSPTARVVASAAQGGPPTVKIFTPSGTLLTSFNAYGSAFTGGVRVAIADITGDGVPEIFTAPGPGGAPFVNVFNGSTFSLIRSIQVYGTSFNLGVNLTVGDVLGTGSPQLITAPETGGQPFVNVFDPKTGSFLKQLQVYGLAFTGGVRVTTGDITGNSAKEIIVAPEAGGSPIVNVFDGTTGALTTQIQAFGLSFTGGLYIAAGNVNNSGKDDLIVGPGFTGAPYVNIFEGSTGSRISQYLVYGLSFTVGVRVAAVDADGNGTADFIAGPGPTGDSVIKVKNSSTGVDFGVFNAFPGLTFGVFVAGGNT